MIYKILCLPFFAVVGFGVYFGLQSVTFSLAENPVLLFVFLITVAAITVLIGVAAFRATVRRTIIQNIAHEYQISEDQAEAYLPLLQKYGANADILEHKEVNRCR